MCLAMCATFANVLDIFTDEFFLDAIGSILLEYYLIL